MWEKTTRFTMKYFFEGITFAGAVLVVVQVSLVHTYTHESNTLLYGVWATALAWLTTAFVFSTTRADSDGNALTTKVTCTSLLLFTQALVVGASLTLSEPRRHKHEIGILICGLLHVLTQFAAAIKGHDIVRQKVSLNSRCAAYVIV